MKTTEATLPVDDIFPNPGQPRKDFDPQALEELAANIGRYGVMQPLVVAPRKGKHMIIAGERRWRASRMAGLQSVPVRIVDASDEVIEELALIENLLRRDLTVVEEARAYRALLDRGMDEKQLAKKLGMKQSWRISERTSLLNLRPEYLDMVEKGALGNSQAFEMSRLPREKQHLVFRQIRAGCLTSYNRLRAFVDGLLGVGETEAMFAVEEPTEEERRALTRFEKTIGKAASLLAQSFDDGEIVAVRKMMPGNLELNLQRLDLVIGHLQKLRKAMDTARMRQKALDLAS